MFALSYATFLWFTLTFVGVAWLTPDLGVEAMAAVPAGLACKILLPGLTWRIHLLSGLALAFAYYVKASMFPLGFLFLAI